MREHQPRIDVYSESFEKAIKHGMELWWSDSTPKKRLDQRGGRTGFTRYVNARVEGKLAEVAFSQFLRYEFGIDSQVDWRIYGDYNTTDDGDLQYLVGDDGEHYSMAVELDVKKTKPWNSWLAIREEVFQRHPDDAPFVLTKLVIDDDMNVDAWENESEWNDVSNDLQFRSRFNDFAEEYFPLPVDIVGTAYKHEFTDKFEKGDSLYDPESGKKFNDTLRRANRGIHVDDLVATNDRWNRVVSEIVGENPISYDTI